MSSRVLLRQDNSGQVQTMVWRTSAQNGTDVATRSNQSARFEPSVTIDPEAAALRNRVVEMEHASRQAVEAARRSGLSEGEAQGRRQATQELEPVLNNLGRSLTELANLRAKLREEAELDVVQLSLAIARRILHRELSVDPGAIQALVQVALERLARQELYRVRIHPAQADALQVALGAHHSKVEVLTDPRLEIGSLVFETNRGKMDASVAAQFEEIERGLTDRVKNT